MYRLRKISTKNNPIMKFDLISKAENRSFDSGKGILAKIERLDMALVKVKDLLEDATKHHYGVPAINSINPETVRFAIEAAEHERLPIIVQYYPGFCDYMPVNVMAFAACQYARRASVPVAVHLDHSKGYDIAVGGIRDGFPSVMVDGSSLPYEENVRLTSDVVNIGKVFDVDVEAELGHVGEGSSVDDIVNTDYYTRPDQAVDFVEKTGCGSLAVAVGNAHGPYCKEPDLDFDRIKELRAAVDLPLVMHGCSGIPDDQMQEAVNLGMSKFNIATEYFRCIYHSVEKHIAGEKVYDGDGVSLGSCCADDAHAFVAKKLQLLNPNHFSL